MNRRDRRAVAENADSRDETIAELRRENRELAAHLDQVTDGFLALDDEWRITYLNEQAAALLDRDHASLLGVNVWEAFPPAVQTDFYEASTEARETGRPTRVEEYYEPLDRWFEAQAYPDGDELAVYFRDITDLKHRERELERQNRRLEKFASMVSHDLRNPLTVASGSLELARQSDDSVVHLDRVDAALDRMGALIEDMLTLARNGQQVEETSRVPLETAVSMARETVQLDGGSLEIAVEDYAVHADEARLRQMLENLLSNAVNHGPDDVTITIGRLRDREGFYVADDGPGIPDDQRETVFEYGYSTTESGTGLGLSIVRDIAQAHGWTVNATESADGGASIDVVVEPPATTATDEG